MRRTVFTHSLDCELAHDIEFQCVLNDAKGVKGVDDRSRAGEFNARLGGQTAGYRSGEAHPCAGGAQAMCLEEGGGVSGVEAKSDWISTDRCAIVSMCSAGILHTSAVTM